MRARECAQRPEIPRETKNACAVIRRFHVNIIEVKNHRARVFDQYPALTRLTIR